MAKGRGTVLTPSQCQSHFRATERGCALFRGAGGRELVRWERKTGNSTAGFLSALDPATCCQCASGCSLSFSQSEFANQSNMNVLRGEAYFLRSWVPQSLRANAQLGSFGLLVPVPCQTRGLASPLQSARLLRRGPYLPE